MRRRIVSRGSSAVLGEPGARVGFESFDRVEVHPHFTFVATLSTFWLPGLDARAERRHVSIVAVKRLCVGAGPRALNPPTDGRVDDEPTKRVDQSHVERRQASDRLHVDRKVERVTRCMTAEGSAFVGWTTDSSSQSS